MSEVTEQKSYQDVVATASAKSNSDSTPANYFSDLPVRTGVIAGMVGSVAIIVVIGLLAVLSGQDPMLSPRIISSVILGEGAFTGPLPIIVGTAMHFAAGAAYGAIFAFAVPRMPRGFWFVAALVFSMLIWGIAAVLLPILANTPPELTTIQYTNAQIISHLTYGITLGFAAAFFGNVTSETGA
ncbi:MAG: DUF6789 family protein [Chloroflexota bacterium]